MFRIALLLVVLACRCDPKTSEVAPPAPEMSDVSLTEPVIARTGTPPTAPEAAWEKDSGKCAHRIQLEAFTHISDSVLNANGVGKATPLVLVEDGTPLKGFAQPNDYRERCTGSFAFPKSFMVFSPSDEAGADAHKYALILSEDVPMQSPEGPVYWVYPGTSLEVRFPVDPPGAEVELSAVVRFYGESASPPTLRSGEASAPMKRKGRTLRASLTTETPWVMIHSPADGPWLIVTSLVVAVGEKTVVIVGESEE